MHGNDSSLRTETSPLQKTQRRSKSLTLTSTSRIFRRDGRCVLSPSTSMTASNQHRYNSHPLTRLGIIRPGTALEVEAVSLSWHGPPQCPAPAPWAAVKTSPSPEIPRGTWGFAISSERGRGRSFVDIGYRCIVKSTAWNLHRCQRTRRVYPRL